MSQLDTNAQILRQELLQREYDSRQPGAIEKLAEQVEQLRMELATIRTQTDTSGDADELVSAIKAYTDEALDAVNDEVDKLSQHRRVQADDVHDLHIKLDGLVDRIERLEKQAKAAKPKAVVRVQAPARPVVTQ